MADIQQIKKMALMAAQAHSDAPSEYSMEDIEAASLALRDEFQALGGSINQFKKNRYDIYEIIIETADQIVPNKVIDAVSIFAEVKIVKQGQKAMFKNPGLGRNRAKQFLTQVGLSGVYETFRLDAGSFEVGAYAVGGGITVDYERMLDGAEDMADVMEIITDGLVDAAYIQVQKTLREALTAAGRPTANKVISAGFNATQMVSLVNVVKSYGSGAVIFAPPEFIGAMGPDAIVPVPASGNYGGVYHPQDIDAIHNQGYINIFRGTPIVQIPQSFIDENNVKTWIDPQIAYVLPTGKSRVVKLVLEGDTQVNDFQNRDNSFEIHFYKKMGCAILTHHNWGIYQNTNITQTYESPYGI